MASTQGDYCAQEERVLVAVVIMTEKEAVGEMVRAAGFAKKFNVQEDRLRRRFNGIPSKLGHAPTHKKLDDAQEMSVTRFIDRLKDIGKSMGPSLIICRNNLDSDQSQLAGYSVRPHMMVGCANQLLRQAWSPNPLLLADVVQQPPVVSESWLRRFMDRYEEYRKTREKAQKSARARAFDSAEDIMEW